MKKHYKKAIIITLILLNLLCSVTVLSGCSTDKSTSDLNPKFTYGELTNNQSIESIFKLTGNTTVAGVTPYTNWGSGGGKTVIQKSSTTSDGGVVVWDDNGVYIYSPEANDLNNLKTEFIKMVTRKSK